VTRRVGVAIVGTGSIADYHIDGVKGVPEAELRCVVGRDAGKAAALARRHNVGASSVDLAGVLARADIDAAIVATPDDTHEALAAQIAAAGKAVLLQKPMAADAAACERILAHAAKARVDLQVSFMHRYFDAFARAREMLAAGAIGTLLSVRIRNATPGPDWADWFFRKARVSGGVVHQLGVHGIDLVRLVAGEIERVAASTAILRPTRRLIDGRTVAVENPDSAFATYWCRSGAVATHEMSMVEAGGCDRFRLELYGSEGTIWVRSELGPLAVRRLNERDWTLPDVGQTPMGYAHHRRWIAGLTGALAPETTALDACAGIRVAEAIARSAARDGGAVGVAAG